MSTSTSHGHNTLVALIAALMRNKGMTRIKASHVINFDRCDEINGFIPDATAFTGNAFVIVEAESQEGLAEPHTARQWKTFHACANQAGGHFIAVVKNADEAAARNLLTQVCGNAGNAHLWVF